jgi:hypothetical protein
MPRGAHRSTSLLVLAIFVLVVMLFVVAAHRADGSASGAVVPQAGHPPATSPDRAARCPDARRGLVFYRAAIEQHRLRLDARRSTSSSPSGRAGCRLVTRRARAARLEARRLRREYETWFERTYAKWRCIHEHEGAWNDPHPTYYGGLQMDVDFMRSHGAEYLERWGTADRWPVWAQLRAAEDAHRTRGFHPWPNTARACGLI